MTKTKNHCFHCALPINQDQVISKEITGEKQLFCCYGCATVCETIYASGMQGFYKITPENMPLAPPPPAPEQLAYYDLDDIQADYTDINQDQRQVDLLIEGIHCAACVWLIENRLRQLTGIQAAKVNLTGRKLKCEWLNSQISLSKILQTLAQIGYIATPYSEDKASLSLKKQNRDLLYRMAIAAFGMMNLLWISIALYSGADQGEYRALFHYIGLAIATPVLIYSGTPFFKGAWMGLKSRHLNMDLPIAIGAFISWAYSTWVTLGQTTGAVYFDTVVNFLFVILLGRYLESIFKNKAVSATQRLFDLQPKTAHLVLPDKDKIVPIKSIKKGDLIRIKPGERIAADGLVIEGLSYIDEAMLTGESKAIKKQQGDQVVAGTINQNGTLLVAVNQTLQDSILGKMIELIANAQSSKAPIQCTADRIVPWFVTLTLLFASLTFLYWFQFDFEKALMAATSVLIITCPCAFGLATPMAIAVASGIGAKQGILIKNGAVLESLADIKHFVFDKTGTLTTGKMQITDIFTEQLENELITQVAALESYSEHPIAKAICALAKQQGLNYKDIKITDFKNQVGRGIEGKINQQTILIGQANWFKTQQIDLLPQHQQIVKTLEEKAISPIHIAINQQEVAIFALQDPLRNEAPDLIKNLQNQQIKITLLSGDKQQTALKIAQQLGSQVKVIAEVLPEQKMQVIKKLNPVVMIGDGVNDAPALVQAEVGIALGSGTDVSIASADIVLMHQGLNSVLQARQLAKRTLLTIRQNIIISILYNMVMVPLAMMAFITPLIAAIAMPISSLLVIANAARINLIFKKKQ